METLQRTILEKGIENVKIQFIGESCIRNEPDAVCTLAKYWENDDYSAYVHKIVAISEKPYINAWGEMFPNKFAYYISDLESAIRSGNATIIT